MFKPKCHQLGYFTPLCSVVSLWLHLFPRKSLNRLLQFPSFWWFREALMSRGWCFKQLCCYACSQDHPHARKQLGNRRGGLDWRMKCFDTDGGWMKLPRRFLSFDFERPTCCRVSWRCTTRRPERRFSSCCFIKWFCIFCTDLCVFWKDTLCCKWLQNRILMNSLQTTHLQLKVFMNYTVFCMEAQDIAWPVQQARMVPHVLGWVKRNCTLRAVIVSLVSTRRGCMIWMNKWNQIDTMIRIQDMYLYQCIWYHD